MVIDVYLTTDGELSRQYPHSTMDWSRQINREMNKGIATFIMPGGRPRTTSVAMKLSLALSEDANYEYTFNYLKNPVITTKLYDFSTIDR